MNTTTTLTKESVAALLNGREYGDEISREESASAKAAGLVVVYGYSDDNMELRGAIDDEVGCYGGKTIVVSKRGVVPLPDRDERRVLAKLGVLELVQSSGHEIEAQWCKRPGYSWTYGTDIPHATFDIMEEGEKFCQGIVFSLEDLK